MATSAQLTALIFAVLGLLGFVRWWRMGFKKTKYPLWPFVLTILCVWVIILLVALVTGGPSEFNSFWAVCKAYLIGMLVMFIGMKATKS